MVAAMAAAEAAVPAHVADPDAPAGAPERDVAAEEEAAWAALRGEPVAAAPVVVEAAPVEEDEVKGKGRGRGRGRGRRPKAEAADETPPTSTPPVDG